MTDFPLETLAPALAQLYLHEDLDRFKRDGRAALSHLAPPDVARETLTDGLATAIYYALPLPGRGFKSGTPPTPGRNDPCDCGSGEKFKKCCGRLGRPPAPPAEALFHLALRDFGPKQWEKLAEHPDLPSNLREIMLVHCLQTGQPERADAIAQPLYRRISSLTRHDARGFSLAMDALADVMPPAQRHARLSEWLESARAAPIRSILHQRLAMRCMDEGDGARAREHLAHARQADPEQDEMPVTELSILTFTAPEDELTARAKWWQTRLRKRYGPEYPWQEFIEDVIERGKAVLPDWDDGPEADPAEEARVQGRVERLQHLLANTAPAMTDEMFRQPKGECTVKTAKTLAQPARRLLAELHGLAESGPGSRLTGSDLMEPLADGEGAWSAPDALWLDTLEARPELLGNATVLLALYDLVRGCPDETGHALGVLMPPLLPHVNHYLSIVIGSIDGHGTLSRRTVNGQAIAQLIRAFLMDIRTLGETDIAMQLGRRYLDIHPGDATGVRNILASLYAEHGKTEDLTTLKKRYRDKQTPELTASLMQLHAFGQDYSSALKHLNHLITAHSRAYRQLAEFVQGHAEPDPWESGRPYTGMDVYWELNRALWEARPEALAWLKRNLP